MQSTANTEKQKIDSEIFYHAIAERNLKVYYTTLLTTFNCEVAVIT